MNWSVQPSWQSRPSWVSAQAGSQHWSHKANLSPQACTEGPPRTPLCTLKPNTYLQASPEQHLPRLAHQRSYFSLSWTHRSDVQLNCDQVPIWGQLLCSKCCHSHCPLRESSSAKPSRISGTPALQGRATERGGFSARDTQQNAPSWHFRTSALPSSLVACKQALPQSLVWAKDASRSTSHLTPQGDAAQISPMAKQATGSLNPKQWPKPQFIHPTWWRNPWPTASLFGAATCRKNQNHSSFRPLPWGTIQTFVMLWNMSCKGRTFFLLCSLLYLSPYSIRDRCTKLFARDLHSEEQGPPVLYVIPF